MTATAPLLFQATLVPHRSLSRKGMLVLIGAICVASLCVNTMMLLLGAWPVMGFSGVEVGLAILLVRLHAQGVRRTETILLTEQAISVNGADRKGVERRISLPTAWLRVELEERAATVPGLFLRLRHRRVEIAAELGEEDKRQFAEALRAALGRIHSPAFDNPQLRELPSA